MSEEILDLVTPFAVEIRTPVLDAWDEFQKRYPQYLLDHKSRTRFNLLHDLVIKFAKRRFDQNPKIFKAKGHCDEFILSPGNSNSMVIFRYKKLNQRLLTCNVKTRAQKEYREEDMFNCYHKIFIGYQVDDLWTKLMSIHLTKESESRNIWAEPIFGGPEDRQANLFKPERPTIAQELDSPFRRKRDEDKPAHGSDGQASSGI